MDDVLKELIIDNKLTLTLLALVFTPLGLYTGWRLLHREMEAPPSDSPDTDRRLEAVEIQLEVLATEVARLGQQHARLAAVLERTSSSSGRVEATPRAVTPV